MFSFWWGIASALNVNVCFGHSPQRWLFVCLSINCILGDFLLLTPDGINASRSLKSDWGVSCPVYFEVELLQRLTVPLLCACLSRTMKLIILNDYDQASEWAAKYIRNKILSFRPGPDRYLTLGLPTGELDLATPHNWAFLFKIVLGLIREYKNGNVCTRIIKMCPAKSKMCVAWTCKHDFKVLPCLLHANVKI